MEATKGFDDATLNIRLKKYGMRVSEVSISNAERDAQRFRNDGRISNMWDKIQMMFEIAKHPSLWGPQIALWVGAALLYLVSPFDIIPDLIPALGLSDDVAAILLVLNRVSVAVQGKIQSNPGYYLNLLPEKFRQVVIDCFKIDVEGDSGYMTDTTDTCNVEKKSGSDRKRFSLVFGVFLFGSRFLKKIGDVHEAEEQRGRTNSLKYRLSGFLMRKMENTINWMVDSKWNDGIQAAVDLKAERRFSKGLISLICFTLGLATYRLTPYGNAWVYISAVMMLVSYSFIIVAVFRFIKDSVVFLVGGIRTRRKYPFLSMTDSCISALVCSKYAFDEQEIKLALDEIRANKHLRCLVLRVVYKLFNDSVLRGFLKIVLLSFFFFMLKHVALSLNSYPSSAQIIGSPILMAIEKIH